MLKDEERRPHLVAMVQAYLSTMADLGAETWLMHGTLMGWFWNGKVCSSPLCCSLFLSQIDPAVGLGH